MVLIVRRRSFLLWVALGHVLIAWFTAGPSNASNTRLGHALWVVPFGVAAVACLVAALVLSEGAETFAGVATVVAYASRALAFPVAWLAGWENGPAWFATVVWGLLAAYALRTFRG